MRQLLAGIALVLAFSLVPLDNSHARGTVKYKTEFFNFEVKEVGGTYAIFTFESVNPVIPYLAVSTTPLQLATSGEDFTNPSDEIAGVSFPLLGGPRKDHIAIVENIAPGTDYFVGIIGFRNDGGPVYLPLMNEQVKTKDRKIHVTFDHLEIIDDSDDWSQGEFLFGFFAFDGEEILYSDPDPIMDLQLGETVIGSGDKFVLHMGHVITFNKNVLFLEATGFDNDDDSLTYCEALTAALLTGTYQLDAIAKLPPEGILKSVPPHIGYGDLEGGEWISAGEFFEILNETNLGPGLEPSETEKYQVDFVLHAQSTKVELEYKVHGNFRVYYE